MLLACIIVEGEINHPGGEMSKRRREGILPIKVVATNEPLIARGGLVLPYEPKL